MSFLYSQSVPSTPKCLQYKKNLARNSFCKHYKKYFPAPRPQRNKKHHICLAMSVDSDCCLFLPKNRCPQRIPVKFPKTNTEKKPGGELICKKFGVNGKNRVLITKMSQNDSGPQVGVNSLLRCGRTMPWDLQWLSAIPGRWSLAIPRKGLWFWEGRKALRSQCLRSRARRASNLRSAIPCHPPPALCTKVNFEFL